MNWNNWLVRDVWRLDVLIVALWLAAGVWMLAARVGRSRPPGRCHICGRPDPDGECAECWDMRQY